MGCLLGLIILAVSGILITFFGISLWTIVPIIILWLAAAVFTFVFGHRGFGGGGNTDFNMLIAVLGISAAIAIPRLQKHKEEQVCEGLKQTLSEVSLAQKEYFSKHKTYAGKSGLLSFEREEKFQLSIMKADKKGYIAQGSHKLCDKDDNGIADVFVWDSLKGGLQ